MGPRSLYHALTHYSEGVTIENIHTGVRVRLVREPSGMSLRALTNDDGSTSDTDAPDYGDDVWETVIDERPDPGASRERSMLPRPSAFADMIVADKPVPATIKYAKPDEFERNSFAILLPRSEAIAYGMVEPTRAEYATLTDERREWRLRHSIERAARQAELRSAIAALDALTDPVTRIVLDLHAPVDQRLHVEDATEIREGECNGCESDERPPVWPCRTVTAIAAHHRIALT